MSEDIKNVFVSHIHEDDDTLRSFKELLKNAGYEYRDASIDSSKPNDATSEPYIKQSILAPRIQWAGCVLVLISPGTHESEWVNWEVEYAFKQGKRVVGVYAQGAQESDLPDAFEKYGDALVGWRSEQIVDAVDGKINNFYQPDGITERPPRWPLRRFECK